jgi:hypothetical protein
MPVRDMKPVQAAHCPPSHRRIDLQEFKTYPE